LISPGHLPGLNQIMLTDEKRDNGTSENYVQNHFGGDLRASPNSRRAPLEGGNPLKWAFPFKKTENFGMNQDHRSPCSKRQRFDHPHPDEVGSLDRGSQKNKVLENFFAAKSDSLGIRRPHPVLVAKVDLTVGDSVTFGGSNSLSSLKTSSFLKSFIFVALTIFNELDPMKRALDDARFNQASHS
jgi:hypothetical protein